jgi:hypothetical protein
MPAVVAVTARDLLAQVRPFDPVVENGELVFDRDPPGDLVPALEVLHTGVRAQLTRRTWWGGTIAVGTRPRVITLNPADPIPPGINLLCVEGDGSWDRIHPLARIDHPHLFGPDRA